MKFLKRLLGGNVLYYPGCMSKFVLPDLQLIYEKLLRTCGIDFIKLRDLEVCCGSPVKNAGYLKKFEELAKKNFEVFKQHSVREIICNCPACANTFKNEYPKVLSEWNIDVKHVTEVLLEALDNNKLEVKACEKRVRVTYHDPCHLGRYYGIYEEPRKILEKLGYEVVEMEECQEEALCCGGGGGVRANYPELSREMAKERASQALATGAKILVTACPLCLINLKEAIGKRMKVWDIGMVLVKHSTKISKVGLDISSEFKSEFLWD